MPLQLLPQSPEQFHDDIRRLSLTNADTIELVAKTRETISIAEAPGNARRDVGQDTGRALSALFFAATLVDVVSGSGARLLGANGVAEKRVCGAIKRDAGSAGGTTRMAKQPHGPPMTLGNMRELGVQRLIASCLNDACRHTALIDVSSYPIETEAPSFGKRARC